MIRLLLGFLALLPLPAFAHPHIFVDTGFKLFVDEETNLKHIRVIWAYDEFYSLLITEDLELDQDFDGELTQEEIDRLTGFDMNWAPGFNGDLVARLNGKSLELSGPLKPTATIINGRIVTTHLRTILNEPKLAGSELSVKAFDETYYTAYDVTMPVTISGSSACLIETVAPKIDDELAQMQQQLLRIDPNADLEENDIPLIGERFATDIRILCPGS